MQPQSLFDHRARQVRDTSLEAFEALLPTLAAREMEVLEGLYRYLATFKRLDATGGEIAHFLMLPVTSVRPRLTALRAKGLVMERPARPSRAKFEKRCHPVSPVLSWAAVARAKEQR